MEVPPDHNGWDVAKLLLMDLLSSGHRAHDSGRLWQYRHHAWRLREPSLVKYTLVGWSQMRPAPVCYFLFYVLDYESYRIYVVVSS